MERMDDNDAWTSESDLKQILEALNIYNTEK
jgi:hypothetical protein